MARSATGTSGQLMDGREEPRLFGWPENHHIFSRGASLGQILPQCPLGCGEAIPPENKIKNGCERSEQVVVRYAAEIFARPGTIDPADSSAGSC